MMRLSAVILGALLLGAQATALAARYEIASAETKTTYETHYLKFIPVRGVFDRMTGVLMYEPSKPVAERAPFIHVVIDTTTLRPTTFDGEGKRKMLRGPEFFNVEKFPTIEFRSKKFRYDGERLTHIDGDITLVGVTKPVSLVVLKSGCEPASATQPPRCHASTELVVKRSQFGMNGWSTTVSDEVKIGVELVAVVKPTEAANSLPDAAVQPKMPEIAR
jgi:polyisoprenoid-binding protein YceI